jgi:hypothetical protein
VAARLAEDQESGNTGGEARPERGLAVKRPMMIDAIAQRNAAAKVKDSGIPSSHNNKPLPNSMGPPRFTFLKARSHITPADSAVAFDAGKPGCDQRASSTVQVIPIRHSGQRSDKDLFAGLRVDQGSGHYNRKERGQCDRPVV